ncbi:hypothetical protein ANN_10631 [Periplaneta americana]|uniref:Uncharacterized protein n=1 Tax=Periplaneta americana TaxID=6978 RepID=A0ABQ8T2S8_PERAM|nr:hypothetical protein ANN_10631 [Periplaneta americana]
MTLINQKFRANTPEGWGNHFRMREINPHLSMLQNDSSMDHVLDPNEPKSLYAMSNENFADLLKSFGHLVDQR